MRSHEKSVQNKNKDLGVGGRYRMWLESGGAQARLWPGREICGITDRVRLTSREYEGHHDDHSGYKCLVAGASLAAICTPTEGILV